MFIDGKQMIAGCLATIMLLAAAPGNRVKEKNITAYIHTGATAEEEAAADVLQEQTTETAEDIGEVQPETVLPAEGAGAAQEPSEATGAAGEAQADPAAVTGADSEGATDDSAKDTDTESSALAEEPTAVPETPAVTEPPTAAPETPAVTEAPAAVPETPVVTEAPTAVPETPAATEIPTVLPASSAVTEGPTAVPATPAVTEASTEDPAIRTATETPEDASVMPGNAGTAEEESGMEPETEKAGPDSEDEETSEAAEKETEEPQPYLLEMQLGSIQLVLTAEPGVIPADRELTVTQIRDDVMTDAAEKALAGENAVGWAFRHLLLKISGEPINGTARLTLRKAGMKDWEREFPDEETGVSVLHIFENGKVPESLSTEIHRDEDEVIFSVSETGVYDLVLTAEPAAESALTDDSEEQPDGKTELTSEELPSAEDGTAEAEEPLRDEDEPANREEQETAEQVDPDTGTDGMDEPAGQTETAGAGEAPEDTRLVAETGDALTEENNRHTETDPASGEDAAEADPSLGGEQETDFPAFAQSMQVNGIVISVTADAGVFPAEARLSVVPVGGAQQERVDAAVSQAQRPGQNIADTCSFDITILGPDGTELQPPEGKTVQVSFSLAEALDPNLQIQVYHMEEDNHGNLNAERLNTETDGETVTAESGGFSVYTIVFAYEQRQFSLLAGTTTPAADVIQAVGLVGEATSISLSGGTAEEGVTLGVGQTLQAASKAAKEAQTFRVTIRDITYEILLMVTEQELKTDALIYMDENGTPQTLTDGYASAGQVTWQAGGGLPGWYVAEEDITIDQRITVVGDVRLILCDDCTLTVNGGIQVSPGQTLTVYGQARGTGKLNAVSREVKTIQSATGAGIGGSYTEDESGNAGTIILCGGAITATAGAPGCAGIGGGSRGMATVTITGGSITATGLGNGPGVGGREGDTVLQITGGTVIATGGEDGGEGITGKEFRRVNYRNGQYTTPDTATGTDDTEQTNMSRAGTTVDGVTYAPDGSVYTGESVITDKKTTGTIATSGAEKGIILTETDKTKQAENSSAAYLESLRMRKLREAAAERASSGSPSPGTESTSPETGLEEEQLTELAEHQYNVLLLAVPREQLEQADWDMLKKTGIVYENHHAIPGENSLLDIGMTGVDREAYPDYWVRPSVPQTAEDMISEFGFVTAEEYIGMASGPAGPMGGADAMNVTDVANWMAADGAELNAHGLPFYVSVGTTSGNLSGANPENLGPGTGTKTNGNEKSSPVTVDPRGSSATVNSEKNGPASVGIRSANELADGGKSSPVNNGPGIPRKETANGKTGPAGTGSGSAVKPDGNEEAGPISAGPGAASEAVDGQAIGPWMDGPGVSEESSGSEGPGPVINGPAEGPGTEAELSEDMSHGPGTAGPGAAETPVNDETHPGSDDPQVVNESAGSRESSGENYAYLLEKLQESGLLEHTVVICTAERTTGTAAEEETVPLVILHPEWPEGARVIQKTSDTDLLATILALSPETADVKENVLKTLPGQNLLSLEELAQ